MDGEELIEKNFTTGEVAKLLKVSIQSVARWMNRGVAGRQLRSIKVAGRRRIPVSALREFLAARPSTALFQASSQQLDAKLDTLLSPKTKGRRSVNATTNAGNATNG